MPQSVLAILFLGAASLVAGLCIPLIMRRVPMNRFYGVRFPQSFRSDAAWYAINAYGGRATLVAVLPLFLTGLWHLGPALPPAYTLASVGLSVLSLLAAALYTYCFARRYTAAPNS